MSLTTASDELRARLGSQVIVRATYGPNYQRLTEVKAHTIRTTSFTSTRTSCRRGNAAAAASKPPGMARRTGLSSCHG